MQAQSMNVAVIREDASTLGCSPIIFNQLRSGHWIVKTWDLWDEEC